MLKNQNLPFCKLLTVYKWNKCLLLRFYFSCALLLADETLENRSYLNSPRHPSPTTLLLCFALCPWYLGLCFCLACLFSGWRMDHSYRGCLEFPLPQAQNQWVLCQQGGKRVLPCPGRKERARPWEGVSGERAQMLPPLLTSKWSSLCAKSLEPGAQRPLGTGQGLTSPSPFLFLFPLQEIFYFIKNKIFIGVYLLYNVVLVSTVQQSESAIRIHIAPLFWISFPFRSPQSTE